MRCSAGIMPSLRWSSFTSVVGRRAVRRRRRNIAFRNVAVDGGTLALLRVAITAAPGRLHQKAFPGLHLVAPRRQRFAFVGRAEPHHEPAASARPTAGKPLWGKARF